MSDPTNFPGEATPDPTLVIALARLKGAGLRITLPRMKILEALARQQQPRSIEDLHALLSPGCCDLVTVYRCIGAFEKAGLVRRALIHHGTALYSPTFGQTERYHVVCRDSERVEALDEKLSLELREVVERAQDALRAKGYREVGHLLEFFGVAPAAPSAHP